MMPGGEGGGSLFSILSAQSLQERKVTLEEYSDWYQIEFAGKKPFPDTPEKYLNIVAKYIRMNGVWAGQQEVEMVEDLLKASGIEMIKKNYIYPRGKEGVLHLYNRDNVHWEWLSVNVPFNYMGSAHFLKLEAEECARGCEDLQQAYKSAKRWEDEQRAGTAAPRKHVEDAYAAYKASLAPAAAAAGGASEAAGPLAGGRRQTRRTKNSSSRFTRKH